MRISDTKEYSERSQIHATAGTADRANDEITNTGTIVAMADLPFSRYLLAEVPAGSKAPRRPRLASRRCQA